MKTSKTIGIFLMVVSTAALAVGGYFLYKNIGGFGVSKPNIKFADADAKYRQIQSQDLRFTYNDLATKGHQQGYLPSVGNPTVLVVPVEFSDLYSYTFNSFNLDRLDALFNGTNADGSNDYYESVSSFYKKSSYGKLNINFEITDPFTPSITSRQFVALENPKPVPGQPAPAEGQGTYKIVEDFYKGGKINGQPIDFFDLKYDSNHDKYLDGVWFVYNDNNPRNKDNYWPYVYWYNKNPYVTNHSEPNISAYANCSVAFASEATSKGIDAHTFIHETGHLMGLDDYYTYDNLRAEGYPTKMGALGGLDMMDLNIGDHNGFSKTALGWTNPIIPESSGRIHLKPFESSGDVIILSNKFNDSAFSEYILLEYYTPTGLNEFDSTKQYPNRPYYFSKPGIRAFHVDARIAEITYSDDGVYGSYLSHEAKELKEFTIRDHVVNEVAHSNTRSRNLFIEAVDKEDLIAVIPANKSLVYGHDYVGNGSLFTDNKHSIFTFNEYKQYFPRTHFNDKTDINFAFEVESITPEEAIINIAM